jgi:Protein of unknown function (DUF2523)
MPLPLAIAAGIWATLLTVIVPLVVRVLAALGIGYVTITGLTALTDTGQAYIMANYHGIPSAALGLADIAGGTDALNIIFGSYAASIAIKTAMGVFSRFSTNSAWRS